MNGSNASATSARLFNIEISSTASPDGLIDLTAFSSSLDRRADLTLFAPRGCDADVSLPLVTLLHGVYGSHWAWARNGHAHTTLQSLVDGGHVRPLVLAMPSDGLIGFGSGYTSRVGADAEGWILDGVPELARRRFPHVGLSGMAVVGLSMGGWGALRLAARRPGHFKAAVAMSPLTRWEQIAGYVPDGYRAGHSYPIDDPDLADLLIAQRGRSLPALRVTCGTEDDLIEDVRAMHRKLDAAQVFHEYEECVGGHEWAVWERELRNALIFIDRAL